MMCNQLAHNAPASRRNRTTHRGASSPRRACIGLSGGVIVYRCCSPQPRLAYCCAVRSALRKIARYTRLSGKVCRVINGSLPFGHTHTRCRSGNQTATTYSGQKTNTPVRVRNERGDSGRDDRAERSLCPIAPAEVSRVARCIACKQASARMQRLVSHVLPSPHACTHSPHRPRIDISIGVDFELPSLTIVNETCTNSGVRACVPSAFRVYAQHERARDWKLALRSHVEKIRQPVLVRVCGDVKL